MWRLPVSSVPYSIDVHETNIPDDLRSCPLQQLHLNAMSMFTVVCDQLGK